MKEVRRSRFKLDSNYLMINSLKKQSRWEITFGDLNSLFNVHLTFLPSLTKLLIDISLPLKNSSKGTSLLLSLALILHRSMKFYKHLSQLIYELKDQKWVKISKKPDVTQQQSYQEHNITLTSDERVRAIGWGYIIRTY